MFECQVLRILLYSEICWFFFRWKNLKIWWRSSLPYVFSWTVHLLGLFPDNSIQPLTRFYTQCFFQYRVLPTPVASRFLRHLKKSLSVLGSFKCTVWKDTSSGLAQDWQNAVVLTLKHGCLFNGDIKFVIC